jgi:hypothetical protein
MMSRQYNIPGWADVPGWKGLAVGKRQATVTDWSMTGEHRCPRDIESAPPGPHLTRVQRGNPGVMGPSLVRESGSGAVGRQ